MSQTDYEAFEQSSDYHRRLLREKRFVLDVSEGLYKLMEEKRVSVADIGKKSGKDRGSILMAISGKDDPTLTIVAAIADALGYRVHIEFIEDTSRTTKKLLTSPD